jgi:glutathione synthase/RimK-type ligase-like ATP-grasp enzyme
MRWFHRLGKDCVAVVVIDNEEVGVAGAKKMPRVKNGGSWRGNKNGGRK